MKVCTVVGCGRKFLAKGLCGLHYDRVRANGRLDITRRPSGAGTIRRGYFIVRHRERHVTIAEEVLGRKLPSGTVVHHIDENGLNNSKDNLVICTRQYHALLHARMRALEACGNPAWRKCPYCQKYDSLDNMSQNSRPPRHLSCDAAYQRARYRNINSKIEAAE